MAQAEQAAGDAAQRAAAAERTLATERESTREAAIRAVRALEEGRTRATPPAGNGNADNAAGPVALRTAAPEPSGRPSPSPSPRAPAPSSVAVAAPPRRHGRADRQALAAEAKALHRSREFDGAEELFRTLLESDPEDGALWLGLARALNGRKLFEQAFDAVEQARRLRPGWRDAIWLALQLGARLERRDTFAALAPELGAAPKLSVEDLERLAPLALRAGVHELALEVGETLLAREPGNGRGVEIVAAARWELGDEAGAAELVQRGVAGGEPAMLRAALAFARHIDRFDGVHDLVARLDPPDPDIVLEFADLMLKRGQSARALQLLELLAAVAPDDPSGEIPRGRGRAAAREHRRLGAGVRCAPLRAGARSGAAPRQPLAAAPHQRRHVPDAVHRDGPAGGAGWTRTS